MKRRTALLALAVFGLSAGGLAWLSASGHAAEGKKPKILYITTTKGFKHSAAEYSIPVIKKMAEESKAFEVVCTDKTDTITPEGLKEFDAICFSNTTGDKGQFPLSEANRDAMIAAIKDGKGFIGIHAATDTYKDWAPYYEMIGATFTEHPWTEKVNIVVEDPSHPCASPVPSPWIVDDEIYAFKNYDRSKLDVIMSLDAGALGDKLKKGHRPDADYAVAWCKEHGKGKVFYTSLGHRHEVWDDPIYQAHLLNGIKWVLGQAKADLKVGHPKVETTKWVKIFDGKNLNFGTDWEATDNPQETRKHWTVQPGGILQGAAAPGTPGSSHLYYTAKKFKNFEYRADVCINPGGNSGMYFRCQDSNKNAEGRWKNWPDGYEAQVNNDSGDKRRSGTFYDEPSVREADLKRLIGYDVEREKSNKDFWYQEHIIAVGDRIVIKLNGKVAVDVPDTKRLREDFENGQKGVWRDGYLAYQYHDPGTTVKFKNIEVRELP